MGTKMTDETDDTQCSEQQMADSEQIEDVRCGTIESPVLPSSGNSLCLTQEVEGTELTSEWDAYIDSQIAKDWQDIDFAEREFCEQYLENGYKHRDAAVASGFAANAGNRLINKPLLREYIHWKEAKHTNRRLVNEQFFDGQLAELYDIALGEVEIPLVTGTGITFNAKKFDGSLALAVLRERAKISGIEKPEMAEAAGGVNIIIDVGALTGAKPKVINE